MATKLSSDIIFNNTIIPATQIFLTRKNVFGLINLKPFTTGHVLICSRRAVPKLQHLTQIQTLDLFITAQQVCKKLQIIYNNQYDMTIQNGKIGRPDSISCTYSHLSETLRKRNIKKTTITED